MTNLIVVHGNPPTEGATLAEGGEADLVEKVRSELPGECVEVEPGTELDRVLTRIEADGGIVELLHGDARYQLLPITGDDDLERAWRRLMIARAWAIRDAQPPLGISTAQLVREARGEADGE